MSRHRARQRLKTVSFAFGLLVFALRPAAAQRPIHQLYRSDMPPGAVGAAQVTQHSSRRGYVQPVQVKVPASALLSFGCNDDLSVATSDWVAGLLLGQPYRLKISNIPRHEDQELYPSIEVIDRLHPPQGQKARFPIPIEITQDDLELALRGSMVVRVIYLENPDAAFPAREEQHQRYLDVLPSEDPLHVADELGRPMAIVRIGSRVPMSSPPDSDFLFGSPPVEWIHASGEQIDYPSEMHDGFEVYDQFDESNVPTIQGPIEWEPAPKRLNRQDSGGLPGDPGTIPDLSDPFIDDSDVDQGRN